MQFTLDQIDLVILKGIHDHKTFREIAYDVNKVGEHSFVQYRIEQLVKNGIVTPGERGKAKSKRLTDVGLDILKKQGLIR